MNNDFLENPSHDKTPKIRVVIRKRPLNKKEIQKNDLDIVENRGPQTVIVKELKYIINKQSVFTINRQKVDLTKYIEEHNFNFDDAFDESNTNESVSACTLRCG